MRSRFIAHGIGAVALLLLSACSSTHLSSEWRDTADDGGAPQKLAVVAIVKDESISRLVEDEAVHRLPASAHAVAARQLGFTPGADIQALRKELQDLGFDAAVITRLVTVGRTAKSIIRRRPISWTAGRRMHQCFLPTTATSGASIPMPPV